MGQNSNDEIDLGLVFRKIQEWYRKLLIALYHGFRFVLKNWLILIILIVGGAAAGHFWQKSIDADKKATLIIQANFDSTSYVYNAIELLNTKQKQGDKKFLQQYGFNTEDSELVDLEIYPIVNIMDLLEKSETSDRNLEQYLAQSDFEEDILLSEVYYTEYKYHKLYVTTSSIGTMETVQKVLDYLNSNELLQEKRVVAIEDVKTRIARNEKSIENIDGVFDVHTGKTETNINPSQIFFRHQENNNLHQLVTTKNELISENEKLREQLIVYDNVVTVINKPELHFIFSILDKKRTLIPLGLVMLFFGFHILKRAYLRVQRYAEVSE